MCVSTCVSMWGGTWALGWASEKRVPGRDLGESGLSGRESKRDSGGGAEGQRVRPRDGQGARCFPRGAPGQRDLPRAHQGWGRQVDPCHPQGLACLCARPMRIPAARRPLVVRSAGRGHSLAQIHSVPTCRPPTAHSGLELDRGCCDFQRNSKAPERRQLAPSLLLPPPSVCWPLAAQGSGLVLGVGELAAHAQGAWGTTEHPSPLSGTPNSL